jgi:hypothetical protein
LNQHHKERLVKGELADISQLFEALTMNPHSAGLVPVSIDSGLMADIAMQDKVLDDIATIRLAFWRTYDQSTQKGRWQYEHTQERYELASPHYGEMVFTIDGNGLTIEPKKGLAN